MDPMAQRDAVQTARVLQQSRPHFVDTETTGTGPNAEVIEVAVIDWQGELLYDSLVRPRGRIEAGAFQVHGISDEKVQSAPGWGEIWPELEPVLQNKIIGAYNSDFDLRILKQTHRFSMLNWLLPDDQFFCVMKLYARFAGIWDSRRRSYRWHSLSEAGKQCRIPMPNSHRARDDAVLARAVFEYILNWEA
jgi:DNA polymerase III epsilon subunit-like protein